MNRKRLIVLLCFVLVSVAISFTLSMAKGGIAAIPQAALGTGFTYQGSLAEGGEPANGVYDFEFKLFDAEENGENLGTYTVEDVTVENGLFSVQIDFGPDVFDGNNRWLAIGVRPGVETGAYTPLEPRQAITPSPYALYALDADTVDGLHASELETHYQNVVVVAKSGGDYTSIQAAIDSIADAAPEHPYLVWVAPGVYTEQVTMKPFVHLQGAGQDATVITSPVSAGPEWPPDQATVLLASDTSLRDLTLENDGAGEFNLALLATDGMTRTLLADVTARALGTGARDFAIMLGGSGTGITMHQVSAQAENGSSRNFGLFVHSGSVVALDGGSFRGRGGEFAMGIVNADTGTTLKAENAHALGEIGSADNYGLYNINGATAVLHGGSFSGSGGNNAFGIANNDSGTTLDAEGIIVLAENGSTENYGFGNWSGASAILRGGSFTSRGGTIAYGISNGASGTTLLVESVLALGENASDDNHGFFNFSDAEATLSGGSFTGRGGINAYGITNESGSLLDAESVTALGEEGSTLNYGLHNEASATLTGGGFTGLGADEARGISNLGGLLATNVTALGEDGGTYSIGLYNSGTAQLRNGTFTGQYGTYALGIRNAGPLYVTLEANNITAKGWTGSYSYGLYNYNEAVLEATSSKFIGQGFGMYLEGGTVYLGVSQVDPGLYSSASLTCFQVYNEYYVLFSCP